MSKNVFEFNGYKDFLLDWLDSQPKRGHGLRTKIAEVIQTQTGFVTQVLGGSGHFSPEQILSISKLIGQTTDERQFLLLLLQKERAGTPEYRHYIDEEIEKARENRQLLARRLKVQSFPSDIDQGQYFSSWLYACVHVMTTVEKYSRSRAEIASALALPIERVNELLEFLIRTGLVRDQGGRLETGAARVHLGTESRFLSRHHANLNLFMLGKIQEDHRLGLHYSSVISLSSEDHARVREIFTKAIEKSKAIVKDSEGEKVCAITLNLVEIC